MIDASLPSSTAEPPRHSLFHRVRYYQTLHATKLRAFLKTTISLLEVLLSPKYLLNETDKQRQWVLGVRLCGWFTLGILLLNIILTIIATAVSYSKYDGQQFTSAPLYMGNCSVSKGWATGFHFGINVLSTALLAASNYCMQCLSAPSREDVDRAHRERIWLDIGIPSVGNVLFQKGGRRKLLWFLLLVTSLPIHLMFACTFPDSRLFMSLQANFIPPAITRLPILH